MRSSFITRFSLVVFFMSLASLTLTAQVYPYAQDATVAKVTVVFNNSETIMSRNSGTSPQALALLASNNVMFNVEGITYTATPDHIEDRSSFVDGHQQEQYSWFGYVDGSQFLSSFNVVRDWSTSVASIAGEIWSPSGLRYSFLSKGGEQFLPRQESNVYATTVTTGRQRAVRPPGVCPLGQVPAQELNMVYLWDTTFDALFSGPTAEADRQVFFQSKVDSINAALVNTKINGYFRVKLAYVQKVSYTSGGDLDADFGWEAHSSEVQAIKQKYGAVVGMWVGVHGSFAGTASSPANGDASLAFELMTFDGAAQQVSTYLFGYTLGVHSQVELEPNSNPPYAHEYSVNGGVGVGFRTASADYDSVLCSLGCAQVPLWSNPAVLVNRVRAGVANISDDSRIFPIGFPMLGSRTVCVAQSLGQSIGRVE